MRFRPNIGKIAEAENVRLKRPTATTTNSPAKWTEMPTLPLLKPIVMYLIPDDFSPERLKGKTIEQVCYSINQIGLF